MAQSKKPSEAINGAYTAVPHRVLDSQAFIGASDRAKSFLFALMRQHNGSNNGRYQLTDKWLAAHGWTSKGQNEKARKELVERSLIIQTRFCGGLNSGCNLFAVTWLPITNYVGLDIAASDYHQGAWGNCTLPPTARRKQPKKREMHPIQRGSATPTSGADECFTTLTSGAKEAIFSTSTTPYSGNNVLLPLPPSKAERGSKRIVGKSGRSGIPKDQHQPQTPPAKC